ncbi:DUF2169 family type VI secretion system accessory protein [Winslowiella iniecta]|uniref:DUF2169 family type VI secretion system accessory protein n=1 Tax=Winslowiella iniecta TaxID=1560201 RepID=UPI00092D6C2C|nr:pentapeptide repeat-containing protein [Winslowiella iniecta]
MRIVKPQQLIFLNGRYQLAQQSYLGVSVVAGVYLSKPQHFANEAEIWAGWEKAPLANRIMDLAEPKPFAEYLLAGHAGTGEPVTSLDVSVRVGELQRQWRLQGEAKLAAIQVEPFTHMALDHQYSYGGEGCAENPTGRGFQDGLSPRLMTTGADGLPQVNSPLAAPVPLPQHFHQRKGYLDRVAGEMAGENYLKTLFPGYPQRLDLQYFQLAAPQQRSRQAEWPDDVPFELHGFRAGGAQIQGQFPRVRARVFYSLKSAENRLIPLAMARKTLWLLPDSDLGLLIFTAAIPLDYLLQEPIATMVIGLDAVDAPRDDKHFRGVLDRRLAKDGSDFEFLYDPDLMPTGMGMNVINARQHNPNSLRYRAGPRQDYQAYFLDLRQKLNQHQQRMAAKQEPVLEKIQWEVFPQVNQKSLNQLMSGNGNHWVEGEIFTCQSVEQLNPANMRFQQCQFVDCSFSEMVLDKCIFEYCQFENCTFSAVTFNQLMLNKCRFSEGHFSQGQFNHVQFEQTSFSRLCTTGLVSHGSQWKTCQFDKVSLEGAALRDSRWDNCSFADSDLSLIRQQDGKITASIFNRCQLRQAYFANSKLDNGSILNSDCRGLSFNQCQIGSTTVQQDCWLAEAKFEHSVLNQVGLRGVMLEGSEFTRCVVRESDFEQAQLANARFSLCDMSGVRLKDTTMQHAVWDRCSLQQAVLYHANIRHTVFHRCNLVAANLSMIIRDREEPFSECLLDDITWYPLYQGVKEKG